MRTASKFDVIKTAHTAILHRDSKAAKTALAAEFSYWLNHLKLHSAEYTLFISQKRKAKGLAVFWPALLRLIDASAADIAEAKAQARLLARRISFEMATGLPTLHEFYDYPLQIGVIHRLEALVEQDALLRQRTTPLYPQHHPHLYSNP